MFGYVRPYKLELKIKEFEQFKACYCALCHSLGENYGHFSRLFLSYDFVFLAMLLWPADETPSYTKETCVVSPFCKKICCKRNQALEKSAGYSVILTYWKLLDSVKDDGFFKAALSRIGSILLKRSYRKAAAKYPSFDKQVRDNLLILSDMEKQNEPSIDKTADKFALILAAAADGLEEERGRILKQLLYHTGRWIYISDAVNDLGDDLKNHSYNPVALRFSLTSSNIDENTREYLKTTLNHSLNDIASAYALLPPNAWSGVLMNIIYIGMHDVTEKIFTGELENINKVFARNKEFRR